mgnify:FL=1
MTTTQFKITAPNIIQEHIDFLKYELEDVEDALDDLRFHRRELLERIKLLERDKLIMETAGKIQMN